MKQIVCVPNDVLTTPTQTIKHFDKKLERLVSEMKETLLAMKHPIGVGLSANQIGKSYRLFITKQTAESQIRVFINPKIINLIDEPPKNVKDTKENNKLEGCLSIPSIWGYVHRAKEVTLRYQDITGKEHIEIITGFLAHIVQHEMDHTNGILFSQRVAEQHGKFYRSVIDDTGKEVLEEMTI